MTKFQNAILPINDMVITCGYKHPEYTSWFQRTYGSKGVVHFGSDFVDRQRKNTQLRAPFDMEIVFAGLDYLMGYTVIAKSLQPIDIHYGEHKGQKHVAIRVAHMSRLNVKKGQKVKWGTTIGNYGGTGKYGGAPHAHIELSVDTQWPQYSPTFKGNSTIWKGGYDSTINPMDVFKVARGQTFSYERRNQAFLGQDDIYTLRHDGRTTAANFIRV